MDLAANDNPWGPAAAVRERLRSALDDAGMDRLRQFPAADGCLSAPPSPRAGA